MVLMIAKDVKYIAFRAVCHPLLHKLNPNQLDNNLETKDRGEKADVQELLGTPEPCHNSMRYCATSKILLVRTMTDNRVTLTSAGISFVSWRHWNHG